MKVHAITCQLMEGTGVHGKNFNLHITWFLAEPRYMQDQGIHSNDENHLMKVLAITCQLMEGTDVHGKNFNCLVTTAINC